MIFKSQVFTQASGSVGGIVYSRNQGGMYVRARAKPTNPNTDAQSAVRDAMRTAVYAWSNVLTAEQREVWNTYAFNTPTWNRLGEATSKTGQQMFIRGAIPRLQAGLSIPEDGPTQFDLGDFTPISVGNSDGSAGTFDVVFEDTDAWANLNAAAMLIYTGRPQNATRTFGKGPYQLATYIAGNTVTAPTSPESVSSLFPTAAGQRQFLKVNVTMPDGRLTMPQTLSFIYDP
jgi:hypothetical protein